MGVPISYNIRNLFVRKATTLMTALGIGMTVAVLVTALALTEGLRSVFSSTGDPRQMLVLRKGTSAELTSSVSVEASQIIRQMDGIAKSNGEPMVSPEGLSVVNLPSNDMPGGVNVTVRGILPIGLDMRTYKMEQGRMFSPEKYEVVVGQSTANRYPDAKLGGSIQFGRHPWTIVGIFSSGDSAANSEIWVNLDRLRGDFDRQSDSSSLLVRAESEAALDGLIKKISDDQRLGANAMSEKSYYAAQTSSGLPLEIMGFGIAVIMALGSAFAATNTMYAAVARRSREIGTLRALGFSRGSVLMSFMLESVFLALTGGIIGVLMALPVNGLSTGLMSFSTFSDVTFKFKISPFAIAVGLLFAATIGALGGLLPAWSASRKGIVQAMRDL